MRKWFKWVDSKDDNYIIGYITYINKEKDYYKGIAVKDTRFTQFEREIYCPHLVRFHTESFKYISKKEAFLELL